MGVNLPPMHPFCRSITVPADMTYQEWYDKYVKTEKALKNNDKGDTISGGRTSNYYEPVEFNSNASFNVSLDDCSKEVN